MMKQNLLDTDNCQGQEEWVQLFLDDALNPAECAAFLAHLRRCRACQELLTQFKTLAATLTLLADVPAPAGIAAQVMANLAARPALARRVALGRWLLVSQMGIGLALLWQMLPALRSTFNTLPEQFYAYRLDLSEFYQPVFTLSHRLSPWFVALSGALLSATDGLAGWINRLSQTAPHLQLPAVAWPHFNLSAEVGLAVTAGLGLAWLAANLWLLKPRRHWRRI